MKIKKLHIKNFKSIADLEIIEPNPFTVFIGPNGAGKSNIFEALEFSTITNSFGANALDLFGGIDSIKRYGTQLDDLNILWKSSENEEFVIKTYGFSADENANIGDTVGDLVEPIIPKKTKTFSISDVMTVVKEKFPETHKQFFKEFSRIFIKNSEKQKLKITSNSRLSFSCDNLEKVLKRILKDEFKKEEIGEWLDVFIPGYERIEIESNELSGSDTLLMFEKGMNKPFSKELISDGSYSIICLLTAVFQSDEPQFLCIEEPENGLTPYVIREMVTFFRNACEEKGHYIWLNTHSQSLVSGLTPNEIITVDKINGETKIKQFKGEDFSGLRVDEAWLTNTLGGGLPW